MKRVLAIDQGTTGSTAALFDPDTLSLLGSANAEFRQIYPMPGLVEHNFEDIWESIRFSVTEVLRKTKTAPQDITCIGITNQRETVTAFQKNGTFLGNALVWQDRRTADFCNLIPKEQRESFKKITGLPFDPYFSATKIHWLLNYDEKVKKAYQHGDCLFGNIDTALIYRLTGGESFVTEPSNASRTMLYDIHKGEWSTEILKYFNLDHASLPHVLNSFDNFGVTRGLDFLPDDIPITGVLGDQQSALFGQAGFTAGQSKCTYGTGAFFLVNTGHKPQYSQNGLLTTIAFQEDGVPFYALEGSSYIAGAAVQWLRDNLKLIPNAGAIEALAREAKDKTMTKVQFLPFFTGIGSPHWINNTEAIISGLTRDTGKAQIARACLEGICLSINDLITAFNKDLTEPIKEIRVDGGAVVNDFLMELQSAFSQVKILRSAFIETTALGATFAAAIGAKLLTKEQLKEKWQIDTVFEVPNTSYYNTKKTLWENSVKRFYLS